MKERTVPVLIVGGGPVGLALAVELGTRGIECLLVERGDGTVHVPKMSQLTIRTMEFCRRWGIVDEVKEGGWPEELPGDFLYLTSLAGYELFREHVAPYALQPSRTFTPEGPRHCPQIFFDPILLRRAGSLPAVTLRHRTQLDSFVELGETVQARVTDLASGATEALTASYLVGCDGFDGPVRRSLGIQYEGSGMLSFSISIFFRSSALPSMHDKGWARFYRFVDEAGHWSDLIAIDGRELWRRLTLLDLDPATDVESFDAEAALQRAAGFAFPHEILSVLPWKRRELVANSYGRGRIFIAGDAAHQMSPTGGLGMNTGVADAVDIGWKLAAVLEGWGGPRLLHSYEAERRPVVARPSRRLRPRATSPSRWSASPIRASRPSTSASSRSSAPTATWPGVAMRLLMTPARSWTACAAPCRARARDRDGSWVGYNAFRSNQEDLMEQRVYFEDVEPGTQLPEREFGPHTLVSAIRWAGVQENPSPTHTDREGARAMRGLKGIIASGAQRESYLARMLMDWVSPRGDLRKLALRHTASTFEGDMMQYSGTVVEKSTSADDPWIVCEFEGKNQEGVQILRGQCTLSLPSRQGGRQ